MRLTSLNALSLTSFTLIIACDDGSALYDGVGGAGSASAAATTTVGTTGGVGAGGSPSNGGNTASSGGTTVTTPPSTSPLSSISTTCSVVPVNPNATQQAKNLLCYLYNLKGQGVLSGQQETSWSWENPAVDVQWIYAQTGKHPAVLGGDYLYPGDTGDNAPDNGTTTRAIAWWNAGGIPMIRYHMGVPGTDDTYDNSKGTLGNWSNLLASGTSENASLKAKLDYVAAELAQLQTAGVPVLWAPYHEVQENGWFWWSKGTAAQFIALWQYTYNYLTTTKGLNNLIWLLPYSGTPSGAYHPGSGYVDLAGPDTYEKNAQPFSLLYQAVAGIVGASMPIPLHETGEIPNPNNMFPSTAPWVLFNLWAGCWNDDPNGPNAAVCINTVAAIQTAYSSPYAVTRIDVPNLR